MPRGVTLSTGRRGEEQWFGDTVCSVGDKGHDRLGDMGEGLGRWLQEAGVCEPGRAGGEQAERGLGRSRDPAG